MGGIINFGGTSINGFDGVGSVLKFVGNERFIAGMVVGCHSCSPSQINWKHSWCLLIVMVCVIGIVKMVFMSVAKFDIVWHFIFLC